MRVCLGRTFSDKVSLSLLHRQGQPSTTESPAVSCPRGRWAALPQVCVWPPPWEGFGSASQVRSAVWGLEVGEGHPLPPGVLQSLSNLAGMGRVLVNLLPVSLVPCPCSFPPPGATRQLILHFLASIFSSIK